MYRSVACCWVRSKTIRFAVSGICRWHQVILWSRKSYRVLERNTVIERAGSYWWSNILLIMHRILISKDCFDAITFACSFTLNAAGTFRLSLHLLATRHTANVIHVPHRILSVSSDMSNILSSCADAFPFSCRCSSCSSRLFHLDCCTVARLRCRRSCFLCRNGRYSDDASWALVRTTAAPNWNILPAMRDRTTD